MAEGLRMVHLRTVPDAWHAKVLAARLGAEGIVTHLQGAVAGPYPFGAVSVHVEASQAQLAADLLLADEVEAAFTQRFSSSVHACLRTEDPFAGDAGPAVPGDGPPDVVLGPGDDVVWGPGDELDLRVFDLWDDDIVPAHHRMASRKARALAAFAAIMVAGAPVLAHFIP